MLSPSPSTMRGPVWICPGEPESRPVTSVFIACRGRAALSLAVTARELAASTFRSTTDPAAERI